MTKTELKEYGWLKQNIKQLQETLIELRQQAECQSQVLTDMPRANSEHFDAIPELIARLDELETKINEKFLAACQLLEDIERAIEVLPEREKYLIRLRYIKCYPWNKIIEDMGYSKEQTFRIHKIALKRLSSV